MKKLLIATSLASLLAACGGSKNEPPADPAPAPPEMSAEQQQAAEQAPAVGGDQDAHGCLPSAGQTWSNLRNECVQIFDIADITLQDPANDTLAVYVILSQDKKQAEVFAADLQDGVILNSSKGGYASKDGKIRLTKGKGNNNWTNKKTPLHPNKNGCPGSRFSYPKKNHA